MVSAYLIFWGVMTLVTLFSFARDKMASKKEKRTRTPEAVLLTLVSFGGSIGGLIGMYALRHKTSFSEKFQFAIGIWFAFVVQLILGVFIALIQFEIIGFAG